MASEINQYSDFIKLLMMMNETELSSSDEDDDDDEDGDDDDDDGGSSDVHNPKFYCDNVRVWMGELHRLQVSDILANDYISKIVDIYQKVSSKKHVRTAVCKTLFAEGILKVFAKFWEECYANPREFFSSAGRVKFANLRAFKIILQNYADVGTEMASAYFEDGDVIKRLVQELRMLEANVPTLETKENLQTMVIANLAILHNAVRNDNRNRIHIREGNGIKTIFEYAKSELLVIKPRAFIVLAYCVNEEEYASLEDYGVLDFILKKLRSAASSSDHRTRIGTSVFSAEELVMALHKLASNEQNKKSMVEAGMLPILTKLLTDSNSTDDEHLHCINCVWCLAYHQDNKKKIIEEPGLIERIQELRKINSISDGLKKDIQSLMMVLGIDQPQRRQSVVSQKHIMLSYNWEVKEVVRKLKEFLKNEGEDVWIDVDNLHGNINVGMAEAVENSALVVAAMTQSYKDSNNCRLEFEYAHDRNIPILPLLLQPGYKADGWLGFLVAKKKYVDLSSPESHPQKFREVLMEVRTLLKKGCQAYGPSSSVEFSVRKTSDTGLELVKAVLPCQKWSTSEVQSWCLEIGIKDLKNYDGEDLSELCKVMVRCPEEYYHVLREELHLEYKDRNKLSKALARFL